MASNAISGIGTLFYRWSTTSSEWVEIAEISEISGPSKTRETIEVTTLGSTDGYKEYIPGLREGGTVQLTMNYTRATYEIMSDDFESDVVQNYKVVLPDTDKTAFEFEGLVTELPLGISTGDKITADVTIQVTGAVTYYDDSSGA